MICLSHYSDIYTFGRKAMGEWYRKEICCSFKYNRAVASNSTGSHCFLHCHIFTVRQNKNKNSINLLVSHNDVLVEAVRFSNFLERWLSSTLHFNILCDKIGRTHKSQMFLFASTMAILIKNTLIVREVGYFFMEYHFYLKTD